MRRRPRRFLVAAVSCVACAGNTTSTPPAANIAEFAQRLEELRAQSRIPGVSVVIAKEQQVVWASGFGLADVARQREVVPSTAFHLASLTKPFAATVIMQLVEEGKVSLDDPVSKYGIQLQSSGVVLVRHLLTHTSEGAPGSVFRYNGNRFGLLDSVVTRATGQSFAQELERRILAPLHLPNTAPNILSAPDFAVAGLDQTAFDANLARGYTVNGSSVVPTAYPSYFGTAAGLIASALDVAAFSMAMDRDAFLDPATKALMLRPALSTSGDTLPYGLGWFVTRSRGVRVVWHYGLWTAISALIIKVPERGLTYVVLANTAGLSEPYNLVGDLRSSPWAREFLDAFVHGSAVLAAGRGVGEPALVPIATVRKAAADHPLEARRARTGDETGSVTVRPGHRPRVPRTGA